MYLKTHTYRNRTRLGKSAAPIFFFYSLKSPKQVRQFTTSLLEDFLQTEDLNLVPDPAESIIWVENQQNFSRVAQISNHLTKQSTRSQLGDAPQAKAKIKRNGFMGSRKKLESMFDTDQETEEMKQIQERSMFIAKKRIVNNNRPRNAHIMNQMALFDSNVDKSRDRSRERRRLKGMSIKDRLNERKQSQDTRKQVYSNIMSKNSQILNFWTTFFPIFRWTNFYQTTMLEGNKAITGIYSIPLTSCTTQAWTRKLKTNLTLSRFKKFKTPLRCTRVNSAIIPSHLALRTTGRPIRSMLKTYIADLPIKREGKVQVSKLRP